jgi:transcriptional regulator with XRE-family HTH domain
MSLLHNNNLFEKHLFEQIRISGKSVNKIEKELGYPRNALNNYKNGGEPSGSRLIELANYFGVSPEYLIGKASYFESNSAQEIFNNLKLIQKQEMGKIYQKWVSSHKI